MGGGRRLIGQVAVIPIFALIAAAAYAFGQPGPPFFRAEDVRPHGEAEPHPLVPGLLTWIFGANLGNVPGCTAENVMVRGTYKTELCGTRVLVGGIEARLIFVSEGQINFLLPDHPWENEMVNFQVIHDGRASPIVPVRFGFNRPVISLVRPAFTGMPVWLRVEKPWGTGWLRYPFHTEPWDLGPGGFEVRFQGEELAPLALPFGGPSVTGKISGIGGGWMIGLPREVPREYLYRVPLHLVYRLDRPGNYRVRYTERQYTEDRNRPGSGEKTVYQQSEWTAIEILPSTAEQRRAWLQSLAAHPPDDTVELLSNYLPSLLSARDESALRLLASYLKHPDPLVQQYVGYALNYFDSGVLKRVLPGQEPLRQFVQ
jgi:IPT/TIG domain